MRFAGRIGHGVIILVMNAVTVPVRNAKIFPDYA
jgi:hypothetical protein